MTASPTLVAGRYRLIETLGVGGMGRVWHAWDQTLGRDVAIKEIVPPAQLLATERDELRRRTLREARAAARLNHPSVVRVYDVFETNGRPWIVMEFVQARSLHDILASDGPLESTRAAAIGLALLGALRAAHRAGVMHRDVKPSNVLLSDDGRVVLTDFGIATLEGDPGVTRPGLVLGSPAYISPERARDGTAGPESDLWSLGATLYAAVEGKAPFERNSAIATLTALASEEVEPPRNAGALRWVLNGLLRKDPEARIDAAEAERRLRRAATGGPSAVAARKFRWPWTKSSEYKPPRQAGADGSVSGGPAPGGPVAGGPVAGRPVSGGPVAGGRPGSDGRPIIDGKPLAGGPVAGGPVARGRAAAPGPIAGGPVPGGPPVGEAAPRGAVGGPAVGRADAGSGESGPRGIPPEVTRPDATGDVADGVRFRGERSDGSRSGRRSGSSGVTGTGSVGARPRGAAAVPPPSQAPPAPMPRAPEPGAPVPASRVPVARGSGAPGATAPSDTEGGPRPVPAPPVETPTSPVSDDGPAARAPRSAPPSWPVPRFEPVVKRSSAQGAVPAQRSAAEDTPVADPAVETSADPGAAVADPADPTPESTGAGADKDSAAETGSVAGKDTLVDEAGAAADEDSAAGRDSAAPGDSAAGVAAAASNEIAPAEAAPAEAAPAEAASVEAAPAEAVPVEAVPVEAVPAEAVRAEAAPTGTAPAEGVPVETAVGAVRASGGNRGRAKGRKNKNRKGGTREPEATTAPSVDVDAEPAQAQDPKPVPTADSPVLDTSGRDGSARRSQPRNDGPAEDATTVVAAPGLELLGKGKASASPERTIAAPTSPAAPTSAAPTSPAATISPAAPTSPAASTSPAADSNSAASGPAGPVRALAKVVRPEPSQDDDHRKRIVVLVVAALVLIAAVIFMATRDTEGGDARPQGQDGTPGATSAAPAGPTAGAPTSEQPAPPPPSVAPTDTATAQPGNQRPPLPAGWREHVDRNGFSVYVPAHWTESRDGTIVYFRGDGRTLGIDYTDTPQPDPVADWQRQRDTRLGRGEFPGYREIRIAEVPYFKKAADWEFTYNSNGGRSHVSNRGVIVGPKRAHGFWWQTSDADWAGAAPILQIVYDSFVPDPSKVG